jgi:hypothetical protein
MNAWREWRSRGVKVRGDGGGGERKGWERRVVY